MTWNVEFDNRARKELRKPDKQTQRRLLKWIRETLATEKDPRRSGRSLKGRLKGLWRWRVGDYRVVAHIQDKNVLILIVRIGNRKDIYD